MTKRLMRGAATAVCAATVGLLAAGPAAAITGGSWDSTNHYSNVGMLVAYDREFRFRCSGTLVSPTVFLTAAHCTEGTLGKSIVTFDWDIAEHAPSNLPRATDDHDTGTSATGYTGPVGDARFHMGQAYAHPKYSDFTDPGNWNDVGVVVLDTPVDIPGVTPAPIAPLNYLAQFAQPTLNKTAFTLVGYGTEVRKPEAGPQKAAPQSYPIVRRFTDEIGQKLTPQILQTNGNDKDTRAGGGTCFGDSGGPSFKDGYLTTVTSYGYTDNCRYLGGLQRVDIPSVQNWLAGFGVTPG